MRRAGPATGPLGGILVELVGLASALVTIVAGTLVGGRLLALSRRTGEAPERLIGAGMLAFAALAYPLFLVLVVGAESLARPVRLPVTAGAHLGYFLCLLFLGLFTRRVFRPEAAWAAGAVAALALLEAAGGAVSVGAVLLEPAAAAGGPLAGSAWWSGVLIPLAFGLLFGWTSLEALRYRALLGRRVALGLADPVVVNRFTVWGLGTGLAAIVDLALAGFSAAGMEAATHPLPALLQSASGLANAVTWSLTFRPPRRYREWVRRRAGEEAPATSG